jgi:hypothetical protein
VREVQHPEQVVVRVPLQAALAAPGSKWRRAVGSANGPRQQKQQQQQEEEEEAGIRGAETCGASRDVARLAMPVAENNCLRMSCWCQGVRRSGTSYVPDAELHALYIVWAAGRFACLVADPNHALEMVVAGGQAHCVCSARL